MKTKKFFMTSLLVMGMIIAKAANGFAPELVLVSQPVLTYDANSVTVYYDLQNIGDYTYKGDLYIFLDPDDGYYYAKKYVRICPGKIKRVAMTIPAYRPNPSWTYTVMPYYELGDDLYSFTTFEYFEPLRFCWYGYHDEPWVVFYVGPRIRYYERPGMYRYYYDGYRPMMPPPPPGAPGHGPGHGPHDMPPMDPMHHTYGYHHGHGGYPANHHPEGPVPGYNPAAPSDHGDDHGNVPGGGNNSNATVVPHGGNTPGSMSSNSAGSGANVNNNSGATTRPSGNNSNNGSASTRPSGNNSNNGSASTRPSGNSSSSGSSNVSRPSGSSSSSSSSSSGRTGTTNSGRNDSNSNVSRPSGNSSSSSSSSSSSRGTSTSGSSSGSNRTGSTTTRGR